MRRSTAILSLLFLAACSGGENPESSSEAPPKRDVLLVETDQPSRQPLLRGLAANASIIALDEAEVGARLTGLRILEVTKDIGDAVEKGEVLVRLDATRLAEALSKAQVAFEEAELQVIEADLNAKKADWDRLELEAEERGQMRALAHAEAGARRAEGQHKAKALSDEQLESAQYEVDKELAALGRVKVQLKRAAVAAKLAENAHELAKKAAARAKVTWAEAQADVDDAEIRSPITGLIATRTAKVGAISGTGALFTLYDPTTLVAEARVPQQALRDLEVGQKAELSTEVRPDLTVVGTLTHIAPTIDPENGVVAVRIQADPAGTLAHSANEAAFAGARGERLKTKLREHRFLLPGMFLSGRVIVETRQDALTIPRKAVSWQSGRPYIFVIEDREAGPHVRRVFFKEGLSASGRVEMLQRGDEPLPSVEDRIVLVGQDRLRDGGAVRLPTAPSAKTDEER